MNTKFLSSSIKLFEYYKKLGDQTIAQVQDEHLFWQFDQDSNSIAIIVKHMWGNMRSRWTDFLTADGEKTWRNREQEFEADIKNREELLAKWEEGWKCLFDAIRPLSEEDASRIIYIRNEGHTVAEAINRQLGHYAYHTGQIVFIGKMMMGPMWKSLSIPKGGSAAYNANKFSKPKEDKHFTDEV